MKAARGLLQNGGWCGVLEWYRKETEYGPPLEKRINPEELEQLAQEVGFQSKGWRDLNGKQYMVVLRK